MFAVWRACKNRFGQECDLKQRRRNIGLNLRNAAFDLRDCRRAVDVGLAARMLSCTLLAITCHFLATVHLRLCHALSWQTRKRRNSCPHDNQSEYDH